MHAKVACIAAAIEKAVTIPVINQIGKGRLVAAYALFYAFGYFCCEVLGQFGPRELGAFWPIYFMLFYVLAGLWFGRAFVVLGLAITVLTLIGYFYVLGGAFLLWMAVVNGCGLVLGGLWMRWN